MKRLQRFLQRLLRPTLVVLGTGTFLSILGPFNTHALGWPWVWLYWTGIMPVGALFGWGTGHLLGRYRPDWSNWVHVIIISVVISIPLSLLVFWVNGWIGNGLEWDQLPLIFFYVLVISLFGSGVAVATDMLMQSRTGQSDQGDHPRPGRALLDKLPVRLRTADILAMQSDDHYLKVHTSAGEAMILMRLSDATAACEGLNGMRTHRSWWVARAAIDDIQRGDGRAILILRGGQEVPVSRTYYPRLKEEGWI